MPSKVSAGLGTGVTDPLTRSTGIEGRNRPDRSETACDPRLNTRQSFELAFLDAAMLRG